MVKRLTYEFVKEQFNLSVDSGALVVQVSPNSPAEKAGLKQGDTIVGFNDDEITGSLALGTAIRSSQVGDKVEITYWRNDTESTAEVSLVESPAPAK